MTSLLLALGVILIIPAGAAAQEPESKPVTEAPAAPESEPAPAASDMEPIDVPPVGAPTMRRSFRAIVVQRTRIHRIPGGRRTGRVLLPYVASTGNDMALLIAGRPRVADGRVWLRVHLPYRPNRSYGWIDADHVEIRRNAWRIDVDLRRQILTVRYDGRARLRTRFVKGKPSTPTPRGRFAVFQKVREPNSSPLGPWAIHLTAHSDVLHEYLGGPGRAAIHGMRRELIAPLGTAASNGCVRVPNRVVKRISGLVPPGTPVTIR